VAAKFFPFLKGEVTKKVILRDRGVLCASKKAANKSIYASTQPVGSLTIEKNKLTTFSLSQTPTSLNGTAGQVFGNVLRLIFFFLSSEIDSSKKDYRGQSKREEKREKENKKTSLFLFKQPPVSHSPKKKKRR